MFFVLLLIAVIIASYLLGSVSFAVIFTKLFTKKDVRNYGSGNAGMTNVMRVSGFLPGILTFLCDVLKGFLAAAIGFYFFKAAAVPYAFFSVPRYGAYLTGIAAMSGHCFPIFFNFKGGKAVSVSLGILIAASFPSAVTCLAVFIACFLVSKIVSISSILAALSVGATAFLYTFTDNNLFELGTGNANRFIIFILSLIMTLIVIILHKDNIKRLIKGEEKKLSIRRK